jgi:membrane protease subunit HflK
MRKYVLAAIVILVAAYLLTGVVQVRPGERAVIRRLGRVLEEKPGPGLWIGLPWGIDRVDRVEIDRVRRVEVGYQPGADEGSPTTPPGQLLTGDHNLVNIQVVVDYVVVGDEVENYVVHREQVDDWISRTTEAVLAEWVGGQTVDRVLSAGKTLLPPLVIAGVQERLRPYQPGVQVRGANVAYLLAPDEVKHAFDAVNRAEIEIGTNITRAREEAARRERETQAQKFRMEQQAAAYASEQRRLAEADAAAFEKRLAVYHRLRAENRHYLNAIWWDEMSRLFTQLNRNGRIDLLDRHLGSDGLDITIMPPLPNKK